MSAVALELLFVATEMNIRSITIAVAVLVMSTVAGSAQDWTKGSQGSTVWTLPGSQAQTPKSTSQSHQQTGDSQFFLTRNLYADIDFGGCVPTGRNFGGNNLFRHTAVHHYQRDGNV